MAYHFSLGDEAESDLRQIIEWYKRQVDPGLDRRFIDAYKAIKERIITEPESFSIAFPMYQLRKALMTGFPYILLFYHKDQTINLVAIIHEKRNPKQWENRVK